MRHTLGFGTAPWFWVQCPFNQISDPDSCEYVVAPPAAPMGICRGRFRVPSSCMTNHDTIDLIQAHWASTQNSSARSEPFGEGIAPAN